MVTRPKAFAEKVSIGRKLYVGNLAWSVTDSDPGELFSEIGTVNSAQVLIERETGRSRGFGFVEMATDEDALHHRRALCENSG